MGYGACLCPAPEMPQSKSLPGLNMDTHLLAQAQSSAAHAATQTCPSKGARHAKLPKAQARQMQQSLFSSDVNGKTAIISPELHPILPVSPHRNTAHNPQTWQEAGVWHEPYPQAAKAVWLCALKDMPAGCLYQQLTEKPLEVSDQHTFLRMRPISAPEPHPTAWLSYSETSLFVLVAAVSFCEISSTSYFIQPFLTRRLHQKMKHAKSQWFYPQIYSPPCFG